MLAMDVRAFCSCVGSMKERGDVGVAGKKEGMQQSPGGLISYRPYMDMHLTSQHNLPPLIINVQDFANLLTLIPFYCQDSCN